MRRTILNISFLLSAILAHAQSYLPKPGSMDKYTVFNFSQHWNFMVADTQIFNTSPDMIIRGWMKWDKWGTTRNEFNSSVVEQYHQKNITFLGGVTATVFFFDEASDSAQFKDMVTRNASGNLVPHTIVGYGAYRGNIANPAYRDYIIRMAKIQIDAGVDGIAFDEVLSGYDGASYDGNEGFDDYSLKDFNKFLAAKYPAYSKSDWIRMFDMSESNYLNTSGPLDDLNRNFNYRKYLSAHGWQNNPLTSANPLAAEWGKILNNRADTVSFTFLSKYTTMYWRNIVSQIRQYARNTYGKEVYLSSNGLFPYVDFNQLGMYEYNRDNNGTEAPYVPVVSGHLNGSVSLQSVFKSLYRKNADLAGDVPLVVFIDWPTKMMSDYNSLPQNDKMDYWKIYGAEAYANGLFPAFNLRISIPSDPTAASEGILDFIRDYKIFYKENASYYHQNQITDKAIDLSANGVNSTLMFHPAMRLYTIHLVNHNYTPGTGMTKKRDFTVRLSLDSIPKSVYAKSPDFKDYRLLKTDYSNGLLNITVGNLDYYDVIVLDYKNTVTTIENKLLSCNGLHVFPNPSRGLVNIQSECPIPRLYIRIFDTKGICIKRLNINDQTLFNLDLPGGIYLLKWEDGMNSGVKKLLVY